MIYNTDFDDDPKLLFDKTVKSFEGMKKLTKEEEYRRINEIIDLRNKYKEIIFNLKFIKEWLFKLFLTKTPEEILGRKKSTFYSDEQMKLYISNIKKYIRIYKKNSDDTRLVKILLMTPIHYSIINDFFTTLNSLYLSNSPDFILNEKYLTKDKLVNIICLLKELNDKKVEKEKDLAQYLFRYTVNLAKKYGKNNPAIMMDLLQEGCLSVIRAIQSFTPKFNTRINTYANILIKQDMLEHLTRLKHHIKINWAQRTAIGNLEKEHGKTNVTAEMLMEKLNCNKSKAIAIMTNYNFAVSLSQPTSVKNENSLNDIIEDNKMEVLFNSTNIDDIMESFDFTEDEKKVVKFKFLNQIQIINNDAIDVQKEKLRQSMFSVMNTFFSRILDEKKCVGA